MAPEDLHLKALLVQRHVEFPRTHDIKRLLRWVAAIDLQLAESLEQADSSTPFGVEVRYPGGAPEVLPGGEIEAIQMAKRARERVMRLRGAFPGAR
jgi:HEPN domain-containing protein